MPSTPRPASSSASLATSGKVNLTKAIPLAVNARNYTMTSPPVICRDVVIVGSSISDGPQNKEAPRGDVQAFDVRTGKPAWIFHAIPQAGEFGNDTWEDDSWKYTGNANVWTLMSADEELGYVYLPFSTPTNDWYGGHRLGDDLFAESLVCVDADDRQARLAFSDGASRPVGLRSAGRAGAVRHQGRRQADQGRGADHEDRVHVRLRPHERQAGVADRRAAGAAIDGARRTDLADAAFPTKPAPYETQGSTEENLIDFTPELRAEAKKILDKYDHGPLFTPPTEKGTLNLPGWAGGANWWGAAFDPDTGLVLHSVDLDADLGQADQARRGPLESEFHPRRRRRSARRSTARAACRCSSHPTAASRRST